MVGVFRMFIILLKKFILSFYLVELLNILDVWLVIILIIFGMWFIESYMFLGTYYFYICLVMLLYGRKWEFFMWFIKICYSCGIISYNFDVIMGYIFIKGL